MKIIFSSQNEWERMLQLARGVYPEEGCGFLLGVRQPDKKVIKIWPAKNVNPDRRGDRYEISPAEFYQIEKKAEQEKLEIVGFYHTHPDHPVYPSGFDLSRAWENYSYFILAVSKEKIEVKSWALNLERRFEEEEIARE
ncbi:MAG: M67 family metallopeptidase [Elusimicrobiota bacterium]